MQCPTCGYVMSDLDADCRRCQGLARARAAVWPPPVAAAPRETTRLVFQKRDTAGACEDVPPEVMALKWNWGAFCNGCLWCWKHNLPSLGWGFFLAWALRMSFLHVTSPVALWASGLSNLVTLGLSIYLGMNGHRLAWQNREFPGGFPQFIAVQRAWKNWGLGVGIPFLLLGLLCIPYLASGKPSGGTEEASTPPVSTAQTQTPPSSTPAPVVLYRREPMADGDSRYPPADFHQRFWPSRRTMPGMFSPRPPGVYIPRGYPVIPSGVPPGVSPDNNPSAFPSPSAPGDRSTASPSDAGLQTPSGVGGVASPPVGEVGGSPGSTTVPSSRYSGPPVGYEQPQAEMPGQAPTPNGMNPPRPGGP